MARSSHGLVHSPCRRRSVQRKKPMPAIRKRRTIMADEISTAPAVADPAPLGLAALIADSKNVVSAGWAKNTTGGDWWGYAIAYGGIVQLLAGMWEFRNRNVF